MECKQWIACLSNTPDSYVELADADLFSTNDDRPRLVRASDHEAALAEEREAVAHSLLMHRMQEEAWRESESRLEELLSKVEWAGKGGINAELRTCPVCGGMHPDSDLHHVAFYRAHAPPIPLGHTADCHFAARASPA